MSSRRILLVALLAGAAGCPRPATCQLPFAGDPAQPIDGQLFVLDDTDRGVLLYTPADGDAVPLVVPQQGGYVIYVGARLRNIDPCGVTLGAQLADPASGDVVSDRDQRNADLEPAPEGGGWYRPKDLSGLSTVANLPACPNKLGSGIASRPFTLQLFVTDKRKRAATLTRRVVPTCPTDSTASFCRCTCGPDYCPGKCAVDGSVVGCGPVDAGAVDLMHGGGKG